MAKKKKVSSKAEVCAMVGDCSYSPTISVDFEEAEEISGLSVGDTVRVMIRGKVRALDQREDYSDPKKILSSISIKDFDAEIITDENQFDSLLDDNDE
jgi:hypothetical protein